MAASLATSLRRLPLRVEGMTGVLAPGVPVRRYGLLLLSIAVALAVELKYGNFLTVDNTLTTLNNVATIGIAAVGAAALLIAGRVDLSIAGQLSLLTVLTAVVGERVGSGTSGALVCVLVALGGGAMLGLLNAMLVRGLAISPLIVTLATGGIYTGVSLALTGGLPAVGVPDDIVALASNRLFGIPIPVVIAAGVFLVGAWVLLATVSGLRVYAVGGNETGASLTGVPVDRVVTGLFCAQGFLVGLVALIMVGQIGSGSASLGTGFEIQVLTAALLGGILFSGGGGRPLALLFGVVTIGVVRAALVFIGVDAWWSEIANGAILLLALAADEIAVRRRERRLVRSAASGDGDETAPTGEDSPQSTEPYAAVRAARRALAAAERPASERTPVLEAAGIQLRYGAVHALRGVDFRAVPGEVVCLVGDNGAGKSSLVKVLTGVVPPTEGALRLDGEDVHFGSPLDARRAGMETVYQDLAVCPNLNIAHNIVLGAEPRRVKWIGLRDDRRALAEAERRLKMVGATVSDYRRPVQWLSGGQRQTIAIARVLHDNVRVALFDEPTAALGVGPTARVLEVIRNVAASGVAVILVTHDIEAVLAVADRVVVLRLGEVSFEGPVAGLTEGALAQFMAGLPRDRVLPDLPAIERAVPSGAER